MFTVQILYWELSVFLGTVYPYLKYTAFPEAGSPSVYRSDIGNESTQLDTVEGAHFGKTLCP
jgi:hypothetical protein